MDKRNVKERIFLAIFLFISFTSSAQTKEKHLPITFILFENRQANLIVIPNTKRRYHTFKIYRKTKTDTAFVLVAERKRPALPMKDKVGSYGVSWEDKQYNTPEVEYQVFTFDKNGNEISELLVIWEKQKSPIKKKTV